MNRRQRTQAHIIALLEEADRLDQLAKQHTTKPAPVADVALMDLAWIAGTLGPERTRQAAQTLRARAALLTKEATR